MANLHVDGEYAVTVYKLVMYWYLPPSILSYFEQYQQLHNNYNHNKTTTTRKLGVGKSTLVEALGLHILSINNQKDDNSGSQF